MRRAVATSSLSIRRTSCWFTAYFATNRIFVKDVPSSHNVTEGNNMRSEGKSGASRRNQRGGSTPHNNNNYSGPVKDRFPPFSTNLSDPRRRLAVLVDASSVEPRVFYNTVLPAVQKVGVPVLVRIFAVQLRSDWESRVAGSDSAKKTDGSVQRNTMSDAETKVEKELNNGEQEQTIVGNTFLCPAPEFFRVERFIPVSMQIEADANHIFDFRRQNKIEAVCFVCSEVDRGVFEGFLPNIAGNGFNQYVLDELGMAKEVLEDGRSANGAP